MDFNKIIRVLSVIVFLGVVKANAQQLPQYSNYMINNYVMNPAVGGVDPYFEAISTNRYQWIGITDAPRTNILSVNGPTKSLNVGVGGVLYTDIVGPTRRVGASLSYSYHMNISDKARLAFGLSAGVVQFRVDASKVQLRDPVDIVYSTGLQTYMAPDFGVGLLAYSKSKIWFLGLSVPQIFQDKIEFTQVNVSSTSKLSRHYYATGGYKFYLSDNIKIEPSACLKFVNPVPTQYDVGLRFILKDRLWLGSIYRYKDAVVMLVGYSAKNDIRITYSYDITTSNIRKYSSGTHELMIGLVFKKIKQQPVTE